RVGGGWQPLDHRPVVGGDVEVRTWLPQVVQDPGVDLARARGREQGPAYRERGAPGYALLLTEGRLEEGAVDRDRREGGELSRGYLLEGPRVADRGEVVDVQRGSAGDAEHLSGGGEPDERPVRAQGGPA